MLIREVHHRVKNNLQLMSSILYLRIASLDNDFMKKFLEETRNKIRTIALIHERLLQTEMVNQVDIADYLNKLTIDLQKSFFLFDRNIHVSIDITSMSTDLDVAINCGLILNEVITNAAKYAFVNRDDGAIDIRLRRENGKYIFIIKDNGCGLPENVNIGAGGFGMQMMDVFLSQLNAKADIIRNNGTEFRIEF